MTKPLGVVCNPMDTDDWCEIITRTLCDQPDSTMGKAVRKTMAMNMRVTGMEEDVQD